MRIDRDPDGNPSISLYATAEQTRDFVQNLTADELAWWTQQQELGSMHADLAEDRAIHTRGAAIARAELQRRP